jgi:hypothetical protein
LNALYLLNVNGCGARLRRHGQAHRGRFGQTQLRWCKQALRAPESQESICAVRHRQSLHGRTTREANLRPTEACETPPPRGTRDATPPQSDRGSRDGVGHQRPVDGRSGRSDGPAEQWGRRPALSVHPGGSERLQQAIVGQTPPNEDGRRGDGRLQGDPPRTTRPKSTRHRRRFGIHGALCEASGGGTFYTW